ncbi:MAG TPA: hypothetical protein VHS06_00810, partial [Chloroflexota bacterium]|nr:hypothetical protein [Chloroflexota bacterium]
HDVAYEVRSDSERIPGGNLRDYLLTAMYRSVAPDALDKTRFGAADIRHFLRHGMQWNRFACCAFDCGPILVGKARHIAYDELAAARRTFFDGCNVNGATLQAKRTLVRAALEPLVDFLALYYEEPFSLVQRFRGFREHRDALRTMIHDTQRVLNDLIEREQLDLPVLTYLPE